MGKVVPSSGSYNDSDSRWFMWSCFMTQLGLSLTSLLKWGCASVLIGKLVPQIASALGKALETRRHHRLTSRRFWAVLCVFWTVRPSEGWDKQCWESPCFRKKKTEQNKKPLFLPLPDVWVWIISRYQEFADSSLLIVLYDMKDLSSLSQQLNPLTLTSPYHKAADQQRRIPIIES